MYLVMLILYHNMAVGSIIVSVISMVFLLIIATVGIVAVIKRSRTLCLYVSPRPFSFGTVDPAPNAPSICLTLSSLR